MSFTPGDFELKIGYAAQLRRATLRAAGTRAGKRIVRSSAFEQQQYLINPLCTHEKVTDTIPTPPLNLK